MRTGSSAKAGETWRKTLVLEIGLAAEGIDQRAVLVLRHRVDRQVAAQQVLLERDLGPGVEGEAAIAGRGLALGAREGVLLVRLGMEEHREVGADRLIAGREQRVDVGADENPVAVDDRQAEQCVANRAADEIALHPNSLGRSSQSLPLVNAATVHRRNPVLAGDSGLERVDTLRSSRTGSHPMRSQTGETES